MANPGRHIPNKQADDVFAERQAEVADALAALKKFNPTKIAIESNVGDDRYPKRYDEYLAGKYELTRNENEQIGFRLPRRWAQDDLFSRPRRRLPVPTCLERRASATW